MKTKSFTLFSHKEDNIQTYIQCVINENKVFENKGRILHVKSNIKHNNEQRRKRYILNKERKEKIDKNLERHIESIERNKFLKKEKIRLESLEEKYLDNELEDMESYL